jgi:transcriptional repressor NrdR
MECPDCGYDRTGVVDTRSGADGTTVRRRRECSRCSFRFTTYERTEWESLQVKKRDGSIEAFDREKVRGGIERAVEKRPVSGDDHDRLVEDVPAELRDRGTRIVSSTLVGELVSEKLREVDSVAYVRFVSVYEAFSDPEEFVRELDRILDEELPGQEGTVADADRPNGPDADRPNAVDTDAANGTNITDGPNSATTSDQDSTTDG